MSQITEQAVFAPFIGKQVDPAVLAQLCRSHGSLHILPNSAYMHNPLLGSRFGVTDRLVEAWEYSGIEFDLHLTIEGGILTAGCTDKYRERGSGHGRPVVRALKETQQELRIARRILQYITQ